MSLSQTIYETPRPQMIPLVTRTTNQPGTLSPAIFHPTERMLQILEMLYTARYMRTDQIQKLFFRASKGGKWGLRKSCERTLRRLFAQGYTRRIEQPTRLGEGKKHFIHCIGERGAALLASRLPILPEDYKPKSWEAHWPFMDHLLATVDLRIAFTLACEQVGATLEWWHDERELREMMTEDIPFTTLDGKAHKAKLIPDAAFLLCHNGKRILYCLEVDRGTVTISPSLMEKRGFVRKVLVSKAFLNSQARQLHFGAYVPTFLTVTTSPLRLHHLRQAAHKAGGNDWFLFSTFADALDPTRLLTDCIWYTAQIQEIQRNSSITDTPETVESPEDPLAMLLHTGKIDQYNPHNGLGIIIPNGRDFLVTVRQQHLKTTSGQALFQQNATVEFVLRKGHKGHWAEAVQAVARITAL